MLHIREIRYGAKKAKASYRYYVKATNKLHLAEEMKNTE